MNKKYRVTFTEVVKAENREEAIEKFLETLETIVKEEVEATRV